MRLTLTADEYKTLVANIEQYDDEGHPYPNYSGRGMFGSTCFGWVSDVYPHLVQLELARVWLRRGNGLDLEQSREVDWDTVVDELAYAMTEVGSPSSDGMGRSTVYYWRGIDVIASVQGQDD